MTRARSKRLKDQLAAFIHKDLRDGYAALGLRRGRAEPAELTLLTLGTREDTGARPALRSSAHGEPPWDPDQSTRAFGAKLEPA